MASLIDISNINEKVYGFIKGRIMDLTYPPGHKINLDQLRKELQVSQTPIKDALFRLSGEKLIEITPRKGTYVRSLSERDIAEIYQTRVMLESGAVEVIAPRITDAQCDELEGLWVNRLADSPTTQPKLSKLDIKDLYESDSEFHLTLIRFVGNETLSNIYGQLHAYMQMVRFLYQTKGKATVSRIILGHQGILEALRDRDPDRAKEAIIDHLNKGRDAFLEQSSLSASAGTS